jgi:hypothetical protein
MNLTWLSPKEKKSEVIIYSYSKFIFVWPLILTGFFLGIFKDASLLDTKIAAWIWITMIVTVLLCITIDLHRNLAIFWLTFVAGFWFFVLWLEGKGIPILERFLKYLGQLDLSYSSEMGFVISVALLLIYALVLFEARVNGKWRFTPTEIEHHILGKDRISLGRGFKCVRASYPDLFEFLLGLSGKIVISNSQGDQILQTIEHIPFLPFRIGKIERIMGQDHETNLSKNLEETG